MSVIATIAKASGAAGAGGAVAVAAAAQAPAAASIWSIAVLGIPLAVLSAAVAGAAIRQLREPSLPDRNIPGRVVWVMADGFIGGWAAMALVGMPFTSPHVGATNPAVVGAICALLVQFARETGKSYLDKLFDAFVQRLSGKRSGGDS